MTICLHSNARTQSLKTLGNATKKLCREFMMVGYESFDIITFIFDMDAEVLL